MISNIQNQLERLPAKPGVYIFRNKQNKIIYIGKAINLHQRVRSYFSNGTNLLSKISKLVAEIENLELIVTESEQESLILECDLVKKHDPPYNIRLKDDKSFPYIKIDIQNDWPGVRITRQRKQDGSKYLGPYVDAGSLRQTLRLIKKIFPFRHCSKTITNTNYRPCLNYHIHRCLGPCCGGTTREEYAQVIKQAILFLEGKQDRLIRELEAKMATAADQLQFERAVLIRDQISAIENVTKDRSIAFTIRGNLDIIAFVQTKEIAYFQVFFVRNDKIAGRDTRIVAGIEEESPSQIISHFVKQYYISNLSIPAEIVLQYKLDEPELISRWLGDIKGSKVRLSVPVRGAKKKLLDMLLENAKHGLQLYLVRQPSIIAPDIILNELKDRLHLPALPLRIEGFDISNIRGNLSVGSMVVFENGLPRKNLYRRFKIKSISQIDDYAMIQEVLSRRFNNYVNKEGNWKVIPNLILIDGGKGHLNAAMEIINKLKLEEVSVASIAKQHEDVFIPGSMNPADMPRTSAALHLLQRIRDESHRFAIGYHRKLRSKQNKMSLLDDIAGIGPKLKKALLKKFGSVQAIKNVPVAELLTVNGITEKLAALIKESL